MGSQGNNAVQPPNGSPKRRKSFTAHVWPKRILWLIAFPLRTRDQTDTVDRLFDSKHVNDLRLIVAAAFVLLLSVIALVVALAAKTAAKDPSFGWFVSEAKILLTSATPAGGAFLTLFIPTFAVFGAVLTWAYQRGSARLGVVDLFACEIDTICRVITVIDMVSTQTGRYNLDPAKLGLDGEGKVLASAHFNSQEEYFPILANNSPDLQSLEANVVVNITAFYTFMKAVRDTLRQLSEAKSAEQWQETTRNLIYMLYLGLESARNAMDDLVEFEPTHTERTMAILLSELDAYYFLRCQFHVAGEMHFERLILRGPVYKELRRRLSCLLNRKQQEVLPDGKAAEIDDPTYEERQWYAAFQLRRPLDIKFKLLEDNCLLECAPTDGRFMVDRGDKPGGPVSNQ